MSDVHSAAPRVQWDDVQHVHDIVVTDWEHGELSRSNEFVLGANSYCALCKEFVQPDDLHSHAHSLTHTLLYKEYLSKYSMLMHVKSTMCPCLQNTEERICAAYDAVIMTPSSQRTSKMWETAFRYTAGQKSFKDIRQCLEGGHVDGPTPAENTTRAPQCVCCWSQSRDVMFRPCKHVVACSVCAERLTECPVCRQPITEKESVFCS